MTSLDRPTKQRGGRIGRVADAADDRFHAAAAVRRQINKVFPTHWSFLLGEIALYSFVVLLLSGTYLALFFDPSMVEVRYQGAYDGLRGVDMSRAYESTLQITFEVRGGLFVRQIHHWSALIFMAAILVHMLRVFFTGAFRRPRETNWVIGILLFTLGMAEGFAGYSLPDDLLSGTGLRIMSGIVQAIPVVGTWAHWLVFGSEFPGTEIIPRLYIVHALLLPGILLALIVVHLALVWYQKHTQFPGVGRTEHNVVGVRILPVFAVKSGAFFVGVVAVLGLMAGLLQINPVWLFGPYNAAHVSAGSQPDWYIGWLDGSSRLWPPWDLHLGNYVIPAQFWPTAALPLVMITLAALYPWLERRLSGDTAWHNLLQRPRDVPVRTSLGVMALTFFGVLLVSGGNDIIANKFAISLNAITWAGRIGLLILPPIAYVLTYWTCLGLQRGDRRVLEHGVETGIIKRLPHGAFIEVHQPLDSDGAHLTYQGTPVPTKMNQLGAAGSPKQGGFFSPDPDDEVAALHQARANAGTDDGDLTAEDSRTRPAGRGHGG
ncbi:cytochrome bc1 complex cytochrome b subunit [Actinophytocola algeriensis]|uniref:Cytochrome bc1 complex cytochrome b subunit n=1 Tax=Actinophytocola algeriensis TaxID=1768010 RepID=A0A7W7Q3F3_9PSEU|nr:cytochrome bc complex cytochrome b subunit [Actinophytocola algeriensis]MBB4906234.1 ubiquinol-cytochrome c reductase cytochrome b subunit [Actinophytocola algeriensis]MBE1472081.1 ubiquinol-cytochrome c reductase cytochrome b subunit [Actinophytocola algeriensis]